MKKIFALVLAVFFVQLAISQDSTLSVVSPSLYKPMNGDVGFSFNMQANVTNFQLNNFTDGFGNNSLFMRYYVKDDVVFRLGLGLTSVNEKYQSVDSVSTTLVEWDSTYSRTDFYISPGFEKHMYASERLDPYVGANVSIGKVGQARMKGITLITDTSGTSSGTDQYEVSGTQDGGFLFGINLITGFNYFISERLSIGAEYRWGYNVFRTGGNWTQISTVTPVNGNSTTSKQQGAFLTTVSNLGVNSNVGITLSYFFGKPKS
ncbi:MAG: hypothetical protein JKY53_01550 [Flavobacteriales bacterium]|nr:hypothetical protein [Flavobacteriales bacterium]